MAQQGGSLVGSLLPIILVSVIFYFFLIRPQQKQKKKHRELIDNLKAGDSVVTIGGFIVRIEKVEEKALKVRFSKDVVARIERQSIARVINRESEEITQNNLIKDK